MQPEFCPQCGAEVPQKAKACPECGSCPETGWSEAAHADALGLPDDSFDYEEFKRQEFGGQEKRAGLSWHWWVTALLLLLLVFWLL